MTYSPEIYDWRSTIIPASQVLVAGGQAVQGGFTLGGAVSESPEPGGRAVLSVAFNAMRTVAELDASWTMSRLMDGSIMRVPIFASPQLVTDVAIGGAAVWAAYPGITRGPGATIRIGRIVHRQRSLLPRPRVHRHSQPI